MKKLFVSVLMMLKMFFCAGQMTPFISTLHSFELGANSKNFNDAFSFCLNPAALVQLEGIQAAIYSEKKYLLNELTHISAVVSVRERIGGVGMEFHQLKWSNFSHTFIGLSYGRSLGRIDLGVRMGFQNLKIPAYTNANSISGEVGGMLHLSERANAGIHFSIPGSGNSTYIYGVGIGYEVSDNVFVGGAVAKSGSERPSTNLGLIYRPSKQFNLKAGLITEARQPYICAGWKWRNIAVEIVETLWVKTLITVQSTRIFFMKISD